MSVLSLIPEERKKCVNSAYTPLKYPCILQKKKTLHPLLLSAANMSVTYSSNEKKYIAKRILSAKEHKIKQLQNRLADAHFHLTELNNENRLLRNLQKRQDSALQRYENSQGDIPQLINNHAEEIRAWQVRFKHIKSQLKEVNQKLKDKENELQQLSDDHKHLLSLSKNTNLGEREKLQNEVTNLKMKIEKQNETMNALQRKVLLESKNFKHHLHTEILKQKELQQKLLDANKTIERLSSTVELKDRCLVAAAMKRNFKKPISLQNSHKLPSLSNDSIMTNHKITPLGSDLSVRGSSVADNIKYNDMSSNSNKSSTSTFTLNKAVIPESHRKEIIHTMKFHENKSYNHQSAVLPSINNQSLSDTEPPQSSDEDVKTRIDLMKKELGKQLQKRDENDKIECSPEKLNSTTSNNSTESSSPEDFTDFYNKKHEKENELRNPDNFDYDYIDQLHTKMKEYDISKITEDLKQMELNAESQNKETQQLLGNFCDTVVKNAQISLSSNTSSVNSKSSVFASFSSSDNKTGSPQIKLNNNSDIEMNNNTSVLSRKSDNKYKRVSDLNDDKKKQLLAALDAIDRSEGKISSIDILKKVNNNTKLALNPNKFISK